MARPRKLKKPSLPFGIDESFVDSLNTMSTDEIKSLIVRLEGQKEEAEEMKRSQGYLEAKVAFDMVKGPYQDTKKALRNKTKLAVERLKEKGGL
jgi:hypothetical protein